ncbi:hypothetical protein MN116_008938 [Schistosoma mekongi]|uniref:RNA-binding protein 42 n=1 Tax=Schistosoma mekongi TaxID=38744 RepID=A0AAE1Z5P3_SCHME|nr:hypothetical protein MN116_008938 [Schistosoma mekongi]
MVEGTDKLKQMEEEMDRFEAEIAHQSSGPPPNIPISGGFTFTPVTSFMPPQLRVHQNPTNVVQPVYSVLPLPPGVSMFVPLPQSHVSCYHMNVAHTHLPPPNSVFMPSKASNISVPTSKTEVVSATSVHKDTSNDINSNQKVITAPPQMAGPNELAERAKQAAAAVAAAKSRAEDEDDDVTRALLAAAAGVTYTRVQGPDGKEKVLASITKPPLTPVVTQPSKKSKSADLITDTEVNKVTQSIIIPPAPPSIYRSASTNTSDPVYKKKKYIRTAAGATWEDPTLVEWDPNDFRLFCGDLGNEVTDDTLARAFNRYPSFQKAKVVRDKRTSKSRGYGFVSFSDPGDFTRAMREMNGK